MVRATTGAGSRTDLAVDISGSLMVPSAPVQRVQRYSSDLAPPKDSVPNLVFRGIEGKPGLYTRGINW